MATIIFIFLLFSILTGKVSADVTDKFTGQEQDANGLYYYGSRYYDPDLGRFTQPDSITPSLTSQGLNPYSYVNNNPVNFTDPAGRQGIPTADDLVNQSVTTNFAEDVVNYGSSALGIPQLSINNFYLDGMTLHSGSFKFAAVPQYSVNTILEDQSRFSNGYYVVSAGQAEWQNNHYQLMNMPEILTEGLRSVFDSDTPAVGAIYWATPLPPFLSKEAQAAKAAAEASKPKWGIIDGKAIMPDWEELEPSAMVEWIRDPKGKPSIWTTGNNYAIPGTGHAKELRQMLEFFEIANQKGFSIVTTTAKEFIDEMLKHGLTTSGL